MKAVNDDNEVMIITTEGIIIRMKVSDISVLGRVTSGVKLINLSDQVTVASVTKVREDRDLKNQENGEEELSKTEDTDLEETEENEIE